MMTYRKSHPPSLPSFLKYALNIFHVRRIVLGNEDMK